MREYLIEQLKETIISWDKSDIYAVSLFVYDDCDDPMLPTVELCYNTYTQVKEKTPKASSILEAQWNFAYWLQNKCYTFGTGTTKKIVSDWISEYNLNSHTVTNAFVNILVSVVKELHDSGFVVEQFGKPVPIIIHELEYYKQIADQNKLANPIEAVAGFLVFCC